MPALGEVPAASQGVVRTALQTRVQVRVALGLLCGKLLMEAADGFTPVSAQPGGLQPFLCLFMFSLDTAPELARLRRKQTKCPFNAELRCPGPGDLGLAIHVPFLESSSFSWVVLL